METRNTVRSRRPAASPLRPAGALPLLVLLAGTALVGTALAGEPPADAARNFDTDVAVARVVAPLFASEYAPASAVVTGEDSLEEAMTAPPAEELAAGLNVQVELGRRKFRTRAVDWVMGHSVAVGHLANFLIGGADTGWHLTVDPRGNDEYMLQWRARFH